MDFSQICRSCMKKISLRSKSSGGGKTAEMFCFCLNLNISDEDNLPKQFCADCVNKIDTCYTFLRRAQKVDLTLKNMVSRTETSVIVEPKHTNSPPKNLVIMESQDNSPDKVKITSEDIFEEKPDLTSQQVTFQNITNENDNLIKSENDYHYFEEENCPSDDGLSDSENVREIFRKRDKPKNECPLCHKRFSSKLWFLKHLKKEHSKKNYVCKLCSKTFLIYTKFKKHLQVHSNECNFSCAECGRRYKNKKQLNVHMRNHGDCKPFVCEVCQKSFKRKSVLIYHMAFHQERKFLCNVCGKSFIYKGTLATHMRTHTGERPFSCGACAKAFNTSSSLRRHERIHRGLAPYACETCAKAFSNLGSLIRHRRTHTGERPFRCPWCPHAFSDSWKRKVHLMRMHNVGLAEIPRLTRDGDVTSVRGRPAIHSIPAPKDDHDCPADHPPADHSYPSDHDRPDDHNLPGIDPTISHIILSNV